MKKKSKKNERMILKENALQGAILLLQDGEISIEAYRFMMEAIEDEFRDD